MFCLNCGFELPDSAKFCLSCGKAQKEGVKQALTSYMISLDVTLNSAAARSYVNGTHEQSVLNLHSYVKQKISEVFPKGLEFYHGWLLDHGLSPIVSANDEFKFSYDEYNGGDKIAWGLPKLIKEYLIKNGWTLQPISASGDSFTSYIFVKEM